MLITTTTPTIEGRQITQYLGVISGEAIMGANLFRDFFAGIRDMVGGRARAYEKVTRAAKEAALDDLREKAAELDADAVVGIHLDCESVGRKSSMLMVSASGTAVKLA